MSQCPFCADPVGAKGLLPEGERTCPVCGNEIGATAGAQFSSANHAEVPRLPPRVRSLNNTPAEAPWVPPRVPSLNNTPVKPRASAPAREEAEQPRSFAGQLRQLDIGAAVAFALGSVGLLTASISGLEFLTKPLSGTGLLIGVVGGLVPAIRTHTSVVLPAITCGLCLFVLLLVGSWPQISGPPPRAALAVTLRQAGMIAPRPVEEDEWLDASACAFRTSDLQVAVVSVHVGSVELRSQGNGSPSPDNCLVIRLRVTDAGSLFRAKVPYESWADEPGTPSKHPPELMDNLDHMYMQKTFAANTKIAGRSYTDGMLPAGMSEVLVFPAPQPGIEFLRLKLPASAFGAAGEFRFQIPKSMIEGL